MYIYIYKWPTPSVGRQKKPPPHSGGGVGCGDGLQYVKISLWGYFRVFSLPSPPLTLAASTMRVSVSFSSSTDAAYTFFRYSPARSAIAIAPPSDVRLNVIA